MYTEDDISEETESESSDKDFVLPKRKKSRSKTKPKSDSLTWAEAAEIVLERFDHPLPPKKVLKLIEEADLKTDISSSAPVAVLNSVLNNQSKGAKPIFYKCPTGASSYGLIKTRRKNLEIPTERTQPVAKVSKSLPDFKRVHKMKQKLTPPPAVQSAARSLKPPGQSYPAASLRVKKPLIPPGEKAPVTYSRYTPPLGSLSKAAYYERLKQQPQHRRMMGPTTSALVRPAPPFSRPPPGAALRVMPPKKRIKIGQDENDSDSSCQSKSDDVKEEASKKMLSSKDLKKDVSKNSVKSSPKLSAPSLRSLPRSASQTFKNTVNSRAIGRSASKTSLPKSSSASPLQKVQNRAVQLKKSPQPSAMPQIRKSSSAASILSTANETKDDGKQIFFVGVKFKKLRKGFQLNKESKTDLVTPDSALSSLQVKDLFNASTFKLLPPAYQYQLLMLLPECDRVTGHDGSLRLSPYSLSNGFFSRACQEYKDKLLDGELNTDILTRAKQEVKTCAKLDPWKVKYFEPVYGQSSLDDKEENNDDEEVPLENIKPIESSWVPFVKFSENSTSDFEESLAKIQTQMKEVADKEAKEKAEAECQRKEELVLRNNLLSSTTINNKVSKSPSRCLSPSQRQPFTSRTPHVRHSPSARPSISRVVIDASKEKSKRALKRAQLLQRKKIFDKQLRDAKAKIVEEASSSARKDEESSPSKISQQHHHETVENAIIATKTTDLLMKSKGEPTVVSSVLQCPSETLISTATATTTLDLSNSVTLKKLITESGSNLQEKQTTSLASVVATGSNKNKLSANNTTTQRSSSKTTAVSNSKQPTSRVVHGAASFGTNSNGVCPCNVKAMFLCKQCGSAWHGDCINNDKTCISCS